MAAINAGSGGGKGKLVAMEGDADVISTQLQLLPPSQKILVLPSLSESLLEVPERDIFDARILVRDVHDIFTRRIATARAFLNSPVHAQPKLVFMNGGSTAARIICIAKISEAITGGDIESAEEIFNEIVLKGVSGLSRHASEAEAEDHFSIAELSESLEGSTAGGDSDDDGEELIKEAEFTEFTAEPKAKQIFFDGRNFGNPIVRELGEQTGSAKVNIISSRTTNTLAKAPGTVSTTGEMAGTKERLSQQLNKDDIRRTVLTIPGLLSLQYKETTVRPQNLQAEPLDKMPMPPTYPADQGAEEIPNHFDDHPDLLSPNSEIVVSLAATPRVEYGEACLVDMQSAELPKEVRKTKSVDRFFPSLFAAQKPSLIPRVLNHSRSAYPLQTRPTTSDGRPKQIWEDESFPTLPRTTFLKASTTTIKRSPTSSTRSSPRYPEIQPRVFVDRGTNPELFDGSIELIPEQDEQFTPAFDASEDLVIDCAAEGSGLILERVIKSYREGTYYLQPNLQLEGPPSAGPHDFARSDPDFNAEVPSSKNLELTLKLTTQNKRLTYDPYAEESYNTSDNTSHSQDPTDNQEHLSSPITPSSRKFSGKFVKFPLVASSNPLELQNSFRAFLGEHFPVSEGYSQHAYPVSLDAERLWKSIFETSDISSPKKPERAFDQIVALGLEEGVSVDLFAQISGQIERLGIKKDEINRSGKLDIRYLISNVMQKYITASQDNRVPKPESLAVMLIHELEAYLISNTAIRLLILQYPAEHLATILALRKLIGGDFLAAGILDTLALDPPSLTSRPRTPSNPLSNTSFHTSPRVKSHTQLKNMASSVTLNGTEKIENRVSFSKADYVLPSTATDAEITTFLTAIWKVLMQKSPFYAPELERPPPPPPPQTVEKPRSSQSNKSHTATNNPRDRDSGYPLSSYRASRTDRDSKISRLTGQSNLQSGHHHTKYTPSIASTMRTTTSERGRREENRAWENFYIAEDDSEDDAYDRMILGRGFAKIIPEIKKEGPPPKRNTKKALKWLGLA